MSADIKQIVYRWSPLVESVEMDGEWIILHAENQTMTKLNELGGWVWSLLRDGMSEDELALRVMQEYGVASDSAVTDIRNFLHSLVEADVVESVG